MDEGRLARFRADLAGLSLAPPLAVAVSGGGDSLALLLLAEAACPGAVIAATVDHGLRAEAAAEAAGVAAICAARGIPHATLTVSVAPTASLQAAAREARYAALAGWARAAGATAVLTGHHLDDQAETVLMRVARGAGIAGLAGIRPCQSIAGIAVARPLLGWRRHDLAAIVGEAGLAAADDRSNHDVRFDRVRTRALLDANPSLDPARIASLAPIAAEIDAALGWAADQASARLGRDQQGRTTLDGTDLPPEIARRLLLRAIAILAPDTPPPRGPDLARLQKALKNGEISTLAGLRFAPGPPWRITRAPPPRSN